MTIHMILLVLFVSFSLIVYFCLRSTTDAIDQYSESLSVSTESNLRKLFLFADTRKLLLLYVAAFLLIPFALVMLGSGVILVCVSVVILFFAPRFAFAQLAMRRRRTISARLPDALAQIAGAMKAGSTFSMAVQSFVDEDTGPLGQEMSLLLREQRVGARLEDALDNLAERVQSEEMDLVVSAALIANDIGGNLAEILQGLSETIRRKLEMEGKIDTLTAQGRLQGRVLSALPFLVLLPLMYFEPEATLPMFNSLLGWTVLGLIILMVFMGSFVIRKIVSIDI